MTLSGHLLWLNVELSELHDLACTATGSRFIEVTNAIADKTRAKDDLEAALMAGQAILMGGSL